MVGCGYFYGFARDGTLVRSGRAGEAIWWLARVPTRTPEELEVGMTLSIDRNWIISDRCPQVAMATRAGWVLSWRNGCYDRDQAVAAMTRAEAGDLTTDPAPGR